MTVVEIPEVDDALVGGAAHHERGKTGVKPCFSMYRGRREQRLVESHEVSEEVDEARPGDLPRAFEIGETQGFEQLSVGLQLEVELPRGAPSSDLDVLRIVLADGDALMEDIRQTEETFADLRRESVGCLVERVDLLREARGFFPQLLRRLACLLRLGDVPRDLVATAASGDPPRRERLAPFLVPPNHVGEELRFLRCVCALRGRCG